MGIMLFVIIIINNYFQNPKSSSSIPTGLNVRIGADGDPNKVGKNTMPGEAGLLELPGVLGPLAPLAATGENNAPCFAFLSAAPFDRFFGSGEDAFGALSALFEVELLLFALLRSEVRLFVFILMGLKSSYMGSSEGDGTRLRPSELAAEATEADAEAPGLWGRGAVVRRSDSTRSTGEAGLEAFGFGAGRDSLTLAGFADGE